MTRRWQRVDSALGRLDSAASALASILILAVALLIAAQVVARQIFFRPFVDSLQIGQLAMVFIAYLGLAYNLRTDRHVRATFLFDRLSRRTQLLLEVATGVVSIAAVGVIIWQGTVFALEARAVGARLLGGFILPAFPFHMAVPVLFGLLELELLRKFARDVRALAGEWRKSDANK
jgi:TRAP-type C4-dicarboxylate transport system permease small subunit